MTVSVSVMPSLCEGSTAESLYDRANKFGWQVGNIVRGQARGTFQRRSRAEVLRRFEMLSLPTIHNSEVIMVEVPHCPQLASMAPR